MSSALATTDNYRNHKTTNPLKKYLIESFYSSFMAEVKMLKPKTVLDVGCGEGFTLERLHKKNIGENLVGIDFLKRAIEIGKKERPHLDLRQGNIYKIPFKDNSFDLVICSEVLEHVDDPEKGLKELVRVTKKNLLLSVPNEPLFMMANFLRGKNLSRWGNDIEHINHWSTDKFKKFVGSEITVKKVLRPFPWTLLIAEKK